MTAWRRRTSRFWLGMSLALAIAIALGGCAAPGASRPIAEPTVHVDGTVPPVALTIFAAASLKAAVERAAAAYEAELPGSTITVSTDSSAALETQIEQGAPADVFLSADTTNPRKLIDGGFAAGEAVPFATNQLAIIVPLDNPAAIAVPNDLARPGVRIVAAGDEVPITKYADQLISNLATVPGAPAGFEAAYAANDVSKEDNVTAVVAKVELGEGDAAIVYMTDARASTGVVAIPIVPATANVRATYAGVVVRSLDTIDPARAFLDWLAGPSGQAILAEFGFLPAAAA